MGTFRLDPRLESDSIFMTSLGLCQMRLINDSRFPWMVLVPQRAGMVEIFDLTPLDQTILTFETALAAEALKTVTGCGKINVAALGNQVPQLHVHVIARTDTDPAWPGPVWGVGTAAPYEQGCEGAIIDSILKAL